MFKVKFIMYFMIIIFIIISCTQFNFNNPNDKSNIIYDPPELTAFHGQAVGIDLKWESSQKNIEKYLLFRGTSPDKLVIIKELEGNINEYKDTDIMIRPGIQYYYTIKAVITGSEITNCSNVVMGYVGFDSGSFISVNNAAGGDRDDNGINCITDNDGNIIVSGVSYNSYNNLDIIIWKYTSDGQPDLSFNDTGYVIFDSGNGFDLAYGLDIDNDNNIVITGIFSNYDDYDMGVMRFLPNGELDKTFNGTGYNVIQNPGYDNGCDVKIDSIGNIYVTGTRCNGNTTDITVWKFNSDGSLNTSFNNIGYKSFSHGDLKGNDYGGALVIDNYDNIILTGNILNPEFNKKDIVLWKLDPSGNECNSFGTNGLKIFGFLNKLNELDDNSVELSLDKENRIIIVGYTRVGRRKAIIVRFTSDGLLDKTFFRKRGFAIFTHGDAGDTLTSVFTDYYNNIFIGGSSYYSSDNDTLMIKLLSSGEFDKEFYCEGYINNDNISGGDGNDELNDIFLYDDNYIIATGRSWNGLNFDMILTKYNTFNPMPGGKGDLDFDLNISIDIRN